MFDVDFKLKNETDFTIKVFTMIEGEYAPAVMILKPNEEMLHFKPSIGEISISVMAKRSSEIDRLRKALEWIAECEGGNIFDLWKEMRDIARSALQQEESK